jgi:hypothetical protein
MDEQGRLDLGHTEIYGAYILDMIAHNNDKDRYVYQISTGDGSRAARLGYLAHLANQKWNKAVQGWNADPARKNAPPYKRITEGLKPPDVAPFPVLLGEIRPRWHFTSSMFNTDGQIFAEMGIPAVLFMEDYDISRKGYHDRLDTMVSIDLDYGAAVAACAIESVAEAAMDDESGK